MTARDVSEQEMADMSVPASEDEKHLHMRYLATVRTGHVRGQTPVMAGRAVSAGDRAGQAER